MSESGLQGSPKALQAKPRTKPEEDDWRAVTNPRERKKIQDRLAQRARRKRLAETRQQSAQVAAPLSSSSSELSMVTPQRQILLPPTFSFPSPITDPHHLSNHPTSILTALFLNGLVLGFNGEICHPLKSPPAPDTAPAALKPTALQLSTVHFPWIDWFPHEKMRDNFITYSAIINRDEFLYEIFTLPSFTIQEGGQTWDPNAWTLVMDGMWAQKWGFLLF